MPITFKHSCAYRYPSGEVEGFVGYCHETFASRAQMMAAAEVDARFQISRKLKIIADCREDRRGTLWEFDASRIITHRKDLTDDEWATVQADWKTNVRY